MGGTYLFLTLKKKNMEAQQQPNKEYLVREAKSRRKELDETLQRMKENKLNIQAAQLDACEDRVEAIDQMTIAIHDAESAIMRLGMVLKNVGNPNPYPESYNPESPKVEPTADGLKL